jgi:hypothetical protein
MSSKARVGDYQDWNKTLLSGSQVRNVNKRFVYILNCCIFKI